MTLTLVVVFVDFFINAIMYADDILLLSSSVNLLQNLVALCEREFLTINLKFNVSKSASPANWC